MKTILNKKITLAILSGFLTCSIFAQEPVKVEHNYIQSRITQIASDFNKKIDPKDLKSKEISTEVSTNKTADIYIENSNRQLEIKVWDQPKVKMVTTVYYEGDGGKLTDDEWFEKMNLTLRSSNSSVKIKSGTTGGGTYNINGNSFSWSGTHENIAIYNTDGLTISKQENSKKTLTIYIPKENKLDIESKYSDVLISGNLNKLNADIVNGGFETQDINNLTLRSKYSNVRVGNLKIAEIELINGRFIAKDADDLDLDTKYATIEVGTVKKLTIRSTNDEYEIEEVGTMLCRKNYGNLRITKLNSSMEIDGTNADLKIRNIAAGLESIKINNKYADIRLPMHNVKNYTVIYLGAYSTIYANFEKKLVADKEEAKSNSSEEKINSQLRSINRSIGKTLFEERSDADHHFTATVGDGKGAKLDIKCQNCTVDFK